MSYPPYPSGSTEEVTAVEEYVIGPENIPFFTTKVCLLQLVAVILINSGSQQRKSPKRISSSYTVRHSTLVMIPADKPGFSEHINRYHHFFRLLAAPPSSLHITAFDQRGHGKTSHEPLTADSPQVIQWKKEGKKVKLEKNAKRVTGGWAKALPDIEWFVKRESEVAKAKGKKVFLSGFSMVCSPLSLVNREYCDAMADI